MYTGEAAGSINGLVKLWDTRAHVTVQPSMTSILLHER